MKTLSPVLFSTSNDDWETEQALFDLLDAEFHFTCDVCATGMNSKCAYYFTPSIDGLAQFWQAFAG